MEIVKQSEKEAKFIKKTEELQQEMETHGARELQCSYRLKVYRLRR